MARSRPRRRLLLLIPAGILLVVLGIAAWVAVPILTHQSEGTATQLEQDAEWSTTASAEGADGRTRTISITTEDGGEVDAAALAEGDRIVVTGEGYDAARGVYVAICAIPADAETKPGPCLGGVPSTEEGAAVEEGTVQWSPSTWINDDWAWRLFGARGYEDGGAFTAYLEVPSPVGEGVDCAVDACAIVTRNDHTAAADRVQDVILPIGFAG